VADNDLEDEMNLICFFRGHDWEGITVYDQTSEHYEYDPLSLKSKPVVVVGNYCIRCGRIEA
jgi:hypothetical protein